MTDRIAIKTDKAPGAVGPYSQAVLAGNLLFTAGQIALSPESGEVVGDTVKTQTVQVMNNLRNLLEAAGASLDSVVKTTVYLTDLSFFGEMNEVYAGYFSDPAPSRSCVEVSRLPRDVLVEIEAIALRDPEA